jgi:hypothetical protein
MKITGADFNHLTVNSTNWKNYQEDWKLQEGRFEDIDFASTEPVEWNHSRAYWVSDYPSVLFVRAFLEGQNETYRVYYDTADDNYMVTTNYGGDL